MTSFRDTYQAKFPSLYKYPITFEFGNGWLPMVEKLSAKLEPLCKENNWCVQAKEKYGSLRFYMNYYADDMDLHINKAEADSREICEECGAKGRLTKVNNWWRTLCPACISKNLRDSAGCRPYAPASSPEGSGSGSQESSHG